MKRTPLLRLAAVAILALPVAASPLSAREAVAAEEPLRVLTTTTDLRALAEAVGGEDVVVSCLMKGPEDPHFLEARPSFVRAAAAADVLVVTGMELEIGYEPLLVSESRNPRIARGTDGYVDASEGISLLDVPAGPVDRSHGDVHAAGNPHYLLDPVRGKVVANALADRFAKLRPERADAFAKRLAAFRERTDAALFGAELPTVQPVERLERKLREGTLSAWLRERSLDGKLGGWAKDLSPFAGRPVAEYHATCRYLLDRFALVSAACLESKPGVPPTPRHLASVVAAMKSGDVRVVLRTTFQPVDVVRSVAEQSGGRAVLFAHQPGSVEGTADYLGTVSYNVRVLTEALTATASAGATDGPAPRTTPTTR